MQHHHSTFLSGCTPFEDLCFFAKALDEISDDGVNNSTFLVVDEDGWERYATHVGWPATTAATSKPPGQDRDVVFVGPDKNFLEIRPATLQETEGEIEAAQFAVASLVAIDEVIFACGMGREVLQRESCGVWRPIGPPLGDDEPGIIGFEDIAGFSLDEIYAVGWQGEVWLRSAGNWRRLDSPTSGNLNAVCCAPDGMVYAVGDGGLMLRGRGDAWSVIDTGREETFQDVCAFGDDVFVASDFRILRLVGDKLIPESRFEGNSRPATCLRLLPSDGGVFSMGPKDLYLFKNGNWTSVI